VDLSSFDNPMFERGRSRFVEFLWIITSSLFVNSWIPGSSHRVLLLRLFGGAVGSKVVLKPCIKIKFPWKLSIGDSAWIGEGVWIDNLAHVWIGNNACVSQGAYLCTGSHDWSAEKFDLITQTIEIEDSAWVAAKTTVGPGVTIGEGAVLGLGSSTSKDLLPWTVYSGAPAKAIKERIIRDSEGT